MNNKYHIDSHNVSKFSNVDIESVKMSEIVHSLTQQKKHIVVKDMLNQYWKLTSKDGINFSAYKVEG